METTLLTATDDNKFNLHAFLSPTHPLQPNVRRAAAKTLTAYAELLGADTFEKKLIPVLKELVENDEQLIVRQALAEVTVQLLGKLPSATCKTHLRPVLQQFMFAGPVSSPDIQLVVLAALGKVASVMGADAVVSPKDGWGKLIKAIYEDSKAKVSVSLFLCIYFCLRCVLLFVEWGSSLDDTIRYATTRNVCAIPKHIYRSYVRFVGYKYSRV
jgi:hypothetical protein